MVKELRQRTEGFTIIEILIVLAIAGLIMLIVFLAVPPLERSSRNQQRKTDASAIATAIANYIDNNGGSTPMNLGFAAPNLNLCGNANCTGNTESAHLGYYTVSGNNESLLQNVSNPTAPTTTTIVIDIGYSCNSNNNGLGSASPRTAAILYAVETASGSAQQCVEQ